MDPVVLSGSANVPLAAEIACTLDAELVPCTRERFPDGERHVRVERDIRGADVYLIQPTAPPVDEHLVELLLLADACRRSGARRVTAVVPYFGYARQDRRRRAGEPVSVRVVADLFLAAGVDRVVTVDPHSAALEATFGISVDGVSAVQLLADALVESAAPEAGPFVVVAPDLGATKLAERYAAFLDAPVAIVRKTRVSGEVVRAERVVGEVARRAPIIVDDMISTGATIVAAAHALREAGCLPQLQVAATHGLLVGSAAEALGGLDLGRLLVTDTVVVPPVDSLPLHVVSIAPLLADIIGRLHVNRSIDELVLYR
jgi:ribose-phosphate pyrophosphokinase